MRLKWWTVNVLEDCCCRPVDSRVHLLPKISESGTGCVDTSYRCRARFCVDICPELLGCPDKVTSWIEVKILRLSLVDNITNIGEC